MTYFDRIVRSWGIEFLRCPSGKGTCIYLNVYTPHSQSNRRKTLWHEILIGRKNDQMHIKNKDQNKKVCKNKQGINNSRSIYKNCLTAGYIYFAVTLKMTYVRESYVTHGCTALLINHL